MRTIIKIEPEWNGAHCSLEEVDYILPGWADLPEEFASVWAEYGPFVNIETDDAGQIVGMTEGEEIIPEPTPEPVDTTAELQEAINILSGGRDDELDTIIGGGA